MSELSCFNSRGTANINFTINVNRSQEYTYSFYSTKKIPRNFVSIKCKGIFIPVLIERLIRSGRRALDPIKGESMKIGQFARRAKSKGLHTV